MNFLKSKKWIIPGLVALIILTIALFIKVAFDANVFGSDFRSKFLGAIYGNPFKKQSEVNVSLVDASLNLEFNILEEDKPKFKNFIYNWFGSDKEVKSLSFGIDQNIAQSLKPSLPVTLGLKVTDKNLIFSSVLIPGLQNALIKSDYELATGSSKLNMEYTDSSKYQIKLEDPKDLIVYATSSGMLTTSSKLEGLFKTLPKIDTIDLSVNGKNISGAINLK